MRVPTLPFCAATILLIGACVYVPPVWDLGDEVYYVGEIQEGVTTREEVIERLGKPHRVGENRHEVYYSGQASSGHLLPLLCSPQSPCRYIVVDPRAWGISIVFDSDDVVQELSCWGSDWCEERNLTRKAETGNVSAIRQLITIYRDKDDSTEAAFWHSKLEMRLADLETRALAGDPEAVKELIAFYRAEDDPAQTSIWHAELEKRARNGEPGMMYEYAASLPMGAGLERLKWYCLAAHAGHSEARHQLARYYRGGYVVEASFVRAYVWYTLSIEAEETSEVARQDRARELGIDAAKQRKQISQGLTPAQVAEAERLVAQWEPNPAECFSEAAEESHAP